MKRFSNYFIKGLLFLVPVGLTLYIFYILLLKIDGILQIPIPGIGVVPGVGFVTTILLVTIIGFLVSNFITRRLLLWLDSLLNRLPLVKLLYGSVKDLLNAFVGDKKSFNHPVLARLTKEGSAHLLGFVTCNDLAKFGLSDYVSVYIPQSYNFAGQLMIFPREQVLWLNADSTEVMTFIVSGGIAGSKA